MIIYSSIGIWNPLGALHALSFVAAPVHQPPIIGRGSQRSDSTVRELVIVVALFVLRFRMIYADRGAFATGELSFGADQSAGPGRRVLSLWKSELIRSARFSRP